MKWLTLAALALLTLAPGSGAGKPDKVIQLTKPPHLTLAQKIVEGIKWRQMKYRHGKPAVFWKGVNGRKFYRCYADCSSFLNLLLRQSYTLSEASLNTWLKVKRPDTRSLARHYFQAIRDGNKFRQVKTIADVRAGDVMAIKYLPGDPNNDERNSGHVLLVAAKPTARTPTEPKQPNTRQWAVKVIDQSNTGHGTGDTRYGGKDREGKQQYKDGLGLGVFRVYTDKDGAVAGHAWSLNSKSRFDDQKSRPLVIGRLQLGN